MHDDFDDISTLDVDTKCSWISQEHHMAFRHSAFSMSGPALTTNQEVLLGHAGSICTLTILHFGCSTILPPCIKRHNGHNDHNVLVSHPNLRTWWKRAIHQLKSNLQETSTEERSKARNQVSDGQSNQGQGCQHGTVKVHLLNRLCKARDVADQFSNIMLPSDQKGKLFVCQYMPILYLSMYYIHTIYIYIHPRKLVGLDSHMPGCQRSFGKKQRWPHFGSLSGSYFWHWDEASAVSCCVKFAQNIPLWPKQLWIKMLFLDSSRVCVCISVRIACLTFSNKIRPYPCDALVCLVLLLTLQLCLSLLLLGSINCLS